MNVAVIGAGYVGLVQAAGLTHLGHRVRVGEANRDRIALVESGHVPIYEPGLTDLMERAFANGLLSFHDSNHDAVEDAKIVFLALPTPPDGDGRADVSIIESVVEDLAPVLSSSSILVIKSTVPVGTNQRISAILEKAGSRASVVSNPEFLAEGSAVDDFLKAERIVIGAKSASDAEALERLYEGLPARVIVTDPVSAELTKYAANAYLATRLTFFNAISNLAEELGADVTDVLRAVGLDRRIGPHFMRPGPGYGGSCFPKDTSAMLAIAEDAGYAFPILEAVVETDRLQRTRIIDRVLRLVEGIEKPRVAIWGIAFKAGTDDTRESPAVRIALGLAERGVDVVMSDPEARIEALTQAADPVEAAQDADLLLLATEWPEFMHVDLFDVAKAMRGSIVFDVRNVLDPEHVREAGLDYLGLGRPRA